MNHAYEEFCDRVKKAAKKATRQEKTQLARELMDHLEDHADDLMEHGWEEEAAARHAVEAMGDPVEIGRRYSDQLSSFWLWCKWGCRALLFLLVLQMIVPGLLFFCGIGENWRARRDPVAYCSHCFAEEGVVYAEDLDMELHVMDQTLRVVRVEILRDEATEQYEAQVIVCVYADKVYGQISDRLLRSIRVTGDHNTSTGTNTTVGTRVIHCYVEPGTEQLELVYEQNGKRYSVNIPLEWEVMP